MFRTTGLICLTLQEERFAEEGSKSLLIIYQQQQRQQKQQQQEQSFDTHNISPGTVYPNLFGMCTLYTDPKSLFQSHGHASTHTHTHTQHTHTHTHTCIHNRPFADMWNLEVTV